MDDEDLDSDCLRISGPLNCREFKEWKGSSDFESIWLRRALRSVYFRISPFSDIFSATERGRETDGAIERL